MYNSTFYNNILYIVHDLFCKFPPVIPTLFHWSVAIIQLLFPLILVSVGPMLSNTWYYSWEAVTRFEKVYTHLQVQVQDVYAILAPTWDIYKILAETVWARIHILLVWVVTEYCLGLFQVASFVMYDVMISEEWGCGSYLLEYTIRVARFSSQVQSRSSKEE